MVIVALGFVFLSGMQGEASAQVLLQGNGVTVTSQDLDAEYKRMPPEFRTQSLAKPDQVFNAASGLYMLKVLAAEAVEQGLDKDDNVRWALESARIRILSEARTEQLDKQRAPSPEAIEAYAQSQYLANPKAFDMPEQVRVRHILLRMQEDNAKQKIEDIQRALKEGASFEKLAKERSQDPGSSVKGGDLGLFGRGKMVKSFEDAAFSLQSPGDVSNIIETQFGYHILKLEERRAAGGRAFSDVKETLIKQAQATLSTRQREATRDRILKDAKVDSNAIEELAKLISSK